MSGRDQRVIADAVLAVVDSDPKFARDLAAKLLSALATEAPSKPEGWSTRRGSPHPVRYSDQAWRKLGKQIGRPHGGRWYWVTPSALEAYEARAGAR